jgi:tRNA A-37 threonylcarbamoyl transferase component Bud32
MAELGFAPKLYACEEVGLMQMVVMEFVQGEQWFSPLHSPLYWEKLKGAIQLYHAEGFVHGDLRAPNILVTPDGPKILDFDWAGKIGDAKYLRVLNHKDITWHDEADINEPIVAEHDIFMLDQLKFNL